MRRKGRRARRLFEMVKGEIDLTGRPVVLGFAHTGVRYRERVKELGVWPAPCRSVDAPEKELVEAESLQSLVVSRRSRFARANHEGRWLARAVEMASGKIDICEGYMLGRTRAAQEWSNCLLRADDSGH